VKAPVPGILHPRKFGLEARLYWMWTSHAIFGAEVERLVIPLAVDIDNIIELRIFPAVVGYISASGLSQ